MELSFMEMVVIGIIAFVVFGPEELIRKAGQFGRFVGRMKAQVNNFKVMAEEEILRKDMMKELELNKTLNVEAEIKKLMHPDPPDMAAEQNKSEPSLESEIEKKIALIEKK